MESDQMIYRSLGKSGLKVSILSYGNMTTMGDHQAQQAHFQMTERCIRAGINFFDTAQIYGQAESVLDKNLKTGGWDPDNLIITTKLNPAFGKFYGNCRKRLRRGIVNSLQRMQLDHVDVLYLHRPDHQVPLITGKSYESNFIRRSSLLLGYISVQSPKFIVNISNLLKVWFDSSYSGTSRVFYA